MSRSLEAQLEEATREFVGRILTILRNASLAEVAAVEGPRGRPVTAAGPQPTFVKRGRPRANRESAAGLANKIVEVLTEAGQPTPARTIADKLGVKLDALAKPLQELRKAGTITKRGEKRASKYSLS